MPNERQGFGNIQTFFGTVISASTATSTSSMDVSDYSYHKFQLVSTISQSATLTTSSVLIKSSLDGLTWKPELTLGPNMTNTSSFGALTTRYGYFQFNTFITGNMTSSLYMLSSAT